MSEQKLPYLLQDDFVPMPVGFDTTPKRGYSTNDDPDPERAFWVGMRQMLLGQLDLIERKLGISPRTSELRKRGRGRGSE